MNMDSAIRWGGAGVISRQRGLITRAANMINSAREEGRMEGWIEGEMEKALPIAQNLLTAGMDLETIAKMTELERSQIETLQQISQN